MRFGVRNPFLFAMLCIMMALLVPGTGKAENYFGGMGGYVLPNEFSDVRSSGDVPGVPLGNAGLGNSAMAGGKLGFYLADHSWLGFETEGYFTNPEFEPFVSEGLDAHLRVITWGINALIRYPGKRFQPYLGAGVGLFFANLDTTLPGLSFSDDWVPGLNALAGIRSFVTDSVSLFAEYKFNYATFDLDTTIFGINLGFKGNYSANIIAGGISFHIN